MLTNKLKDITYKKDVDFFLSNNFLNLTTQFEHTHLFECIFSKWLMFVHPFDMQIKYFRKFPLLNLNDAFD